MTETLIEVRQLPVIAERLQTVRAEIEAAVKECESMVCTPDTVQAVKTRRAELRKTFDELEGQRKAVKRAVMAPYDAFEVVYEECVAEPMRRGDNALKRSIDGFESELKQRCFDSLSDYFDELLAANGLENFMNLNRALSITGLKIGMSDANAKTPKKLMNALRDFVERVARDYQTIDSMNSDTRMAVEAEYERNGCDLSAAIRTVNERLEREKAAQEAAERRKAEQETEAAAVAMVDAVAPPEIVAEEPKLYTITFTIKGVTREQALAVREYLKKEGIDYE